MPIEELHDHARQGMTSTSMTRAVFGLRIWPAPRASRSNRATASATPLLPQTNVNRLEHDPHTTFADLANDAVLAVYRLTRKRRRGTREGCPDAFRRPTGARSAVRVAAPPWRSFPTKHFDVPDGSRQNASSPHARPYELFTGGAFGIVNQKLLPVPTLLSAPMTPPCAATNPFAIARPRPVPK